MAIMESARSDAKLRLSRETENISASTKEKTSRRSGKYRPADANGLGTNPKAKKQQDLMTNKKATE